eukprot:CAMPEP_0198296402 /NCGR_PEP_ID=MMETSP1449-20131203/32327_1 /TAXON_ID=420275 /ORGANISM="Attheya septentrionalis, Strain CCMP2084" /LENGTH=605 /DNA_ID=CAMNT_0043997009 /DNA_START=14 /DNA_END=1831 /DNA_ORIENTATION=+
MGDGEGNGSDHLEGLQSIHTQLQSQDAEVVLAGLTALEPIRKDLDDRRRQEQNDTMVAAHDTPWEVLVTSEVLIDVVKLYCHAPSPACRDAASPFMASWSRALSHARETKPGDALMERLPELTQAMLGYLANDTDPGLSVVQRDAEMALHMMTTSNEHASKVIQELGSADVLASYLKRHKEDATLSASIALGQLVARESDNERVETIATESGVVDKILDALEQLMDGKTLGFYSLGGLTIAASCLAVNDSNKRLLYKNGFIPLLVRILKGDHKTVAFDPVTSRCYAAEAIWNLAFLPDLHEPLKEAGVVPLLRAMKTSSVEKERYYAAGALFQLGEKSHHHHTMATSTNLASGKKEMVMMSYNWAVQDVVVKIKSELESAGFEVWLDLEKMSGSTLQAMAEAVEDSAVIISCVSQKYQESVACRTEAEYAYSLNKEVVPLMFEEQPWRASGWLGAQLGTKLWYDFSSDDRFEISLDNLINALKKKLQLTDTVPDPTRDKESIPVSTVTPVTPKDLRNSAVAAMDLSAVQRWLKIVGLPESWRKTFATQQITGRSLLELHLLRTSNPELYYKMLALSCCTDMAEGTGLLLEFSIHLNDLLKEGPPA